MPDPITTILIFIAVIAVTAVLFGAWLIASIVALVCRLVTAPFRARSREARVVTALAPPFVRCINERCRTENPTTALFCRRCGTAMRPAQQVPARRVAMW